MNDKQRSKKIEQATEGVLRWLGFLQQHSLWTGFEDNFEEDDGVDHGGRIDCRSFAGFPYRWVRMIWRREYVDIASDEELESTAIHEALHSMLFAPLDSWLEPKLSEKDQLLYRDHQERIVDLITHYLERRRPEHGYHASGVPNTRRTAKEKTKRSKR